MRVLTTILFIYSFGIQSLMAIEEPKYTVSEKFDDIEIREYSSYIVAEVLLQSEFENVSNQAFQILAGYIGGENIKQQAIEMTTPVEQEKVENKSEKIEMTAPVSQEAAGNNKYRVAFVMPSRFTMETIPEPKDERIILRKILSRNVVVITYSGTWSMSNYQENESKLNSFMKEKGFIAKGKPVWARYDPPFMPWFLRRNEIMIELMN